MQRAITSRRRWLALAASGAVRTLARAAPGQDAAGSTPPRVRELAFEELSGFRTPTRSFYLRSHLGYPRIDLSDWKLSIEGAVRRPLRLGLDELRAVGDAARNVTFECSGNPPGGGLVGTAEWRGAPLAAVLERAGVLPSAREVVLEGSDYGLDEIEHVPVVYARSIPIEAALGEAAMIAWGMNGEALPWEHGAPARAVVPGYYAMSHVKWLARVRVVDRPFRGFYMTKRYFTARPSGAAGRLEIRPETTMKIKSQIARPVAGERIAGASTILTGAAWGGGARVARVEVSFDGGARWSAVELMDAPSPYAWVRWRVVWTPERNGPHVLVCRAFDERGLQQPEQPDPTAINRYGNNWYHRVEVTVQS